MLIAAEGRGKIRGKEYKTLKIQVLLVLLLIEQNIFYVLLLTVARETKS